MVNNARRAHTHTRRPITYNHSVLVRNNKQVEIWLGDHVARVTVLMSLWKMKWWRAVTNEGTGVQHSNKSLWAVKLCFQTNAKWDRWGNCSWERHGSLHWNFACRVGEQDFLGSVDEERNTNILKFSIIFCNLRSQQNWPSAYSLLRKPAPFWPSTPLDRRQNQGQSQGAEPSQNCRCCVFYHPVLWWARLRALGWKLADCNIPFPRQCDAVLRCFSLD